MSQAIEPKEPKPKNRIRKKDFDSFTQEEREKHVKKTGHQIWELDLINIFIQRRKYGLPGTNGGFLSNMWKWMLQEHPLLSTFCAHRIHPFSRKERIAVLWCSFSWAFLWTAVFASQDATSHANCVAGGGVIDGIDYSEELGTDCNDDSNLLWQGFCGAPDRRCVAGDPLYDQAFAEFEMGRKPSCGAKICTLLPKQRDMDVNQLKEFCHQKSEMNSPNDAFTCLDPEDCCNTEYCNYYTQDDWNDGCGGFYLSTVWVALLVFVAEFFLRFLAECAIVQGSHRWIECCAELLGRCILIFFVFLSIGGYAAGAVILARARDIETPRKFANDWFQAKIWAWVMWFPYQIPVYALGYKRDKAYFAYEFPNLVALPDGNDYVVQTTETSQQEQQQPDNSGNVARVVPLVAAPQPQQMQQQQQMQMQAQQQQQQMQMQMMQSGQSPQIGMPQMGMPQMAMPQLAMPQVAMQQMGAPQMGVPQVAVNIGQQFVDAAVVGGLHELGA